MSKKRRSSYITALLSALVFVCLVAVAQVGPPGGVVYADDVAYETVATPRDLPNRGSFDTLYLLGDELAPVASAAPGQPGYHGGRWEVREVEFVYITPRQIKSEEVLIRELDEGNLLIGDVVRRFVCPLVRR